MNSDLFNFPIWLSYAWLSDLSDANWFESYPRDETAMNSDLFIMYIPETKLHWVIFESYPSDNIAQ